MFQPNDSSATNVNLNNSFLPRCGALQELRNSLPHNLTETLSGVAIPLMWFQNPLIQTVL